MLQFMHTHRVSGLLMALVRLQQLLLQADIQLPQQLLGLVVVHRLEDCKSLTPLMSI
jgi:hypothetical protein